MNSLPSTPTEPTLEPSTSLRIDKWLWMARFFKTRSMAADAVGGGHVHVSGERVKPARKVKVGDLVRIRRGVVEWEIAILGIPVRRGPAKEAQTLYDESRQSIARRLDKAEGRRQAEAGRFHGVGRPNRREREALERLRGRAG